MAQLIVELFRSDPPHILDPHQTAGYIIKVPILVRVPLVVLVDAKGTLDRETRDVPREVVKPRPFPSKGRLVNYVACFANNHACSGRSARGTNGTELQ
jgi:hypothetical protein